MIRAGAMSALLLAAVGCSQPGVTIIPGSDLPRDVYGPRAEPPEEEDIPSTGIVYFVHPRRDKLMPVERNLQRTVRTRNEALLVALFGGPGDDAARTEIPTGTVLNRVTVQGGTATVDLSEDFEQVASSQAQRMRLAQVVYTLTEDESVRTVRFLFDGSSRAVIGRGGQVVNRPVSREDYAEFGPPDG